MKCINAYYQSKMTAIWPIMPLSLTPSFRTTQDLPLFNLAPLWPVEMSHPLYQPCISALCPWEDPRAAAAVLQLLAASLVQCTIPAQSFPPSRLLAVENIPVSEGPLSPWTISKCTDPPCGRHGKSSRISKWSSAPAFVFTSIGEKELSAKIGNASRN